MRKVTLLQVASILLTGLHSANLTVNFKKTREDRAYIRSSGPASDLYIAQMQGEPGHYSVVGPIDPRAGVTKVEVTLPLSRRIRIKIGIVGSVKIGKAQTLDLTNDGPCDIVVDRAKDAFLYLNSTGTVRIQGVENKVMVNSKGRGSCNIGDCEVAQVLIHGLGNVSIDKLSLLHLYSDGLGTAMVGTDQSIISAKICGGGGLVVEDGRVISLSAEVSNGRLICTPFVQTAYISTTGRGTAVLHHMAGGDLTVKALGFSHVAVTGGRVRDLKVSTFSHAGVSFGGHAQSAMLHNDGTGTIRVNHVASPPTIRGKGKVHVRKVGE